MSQNSYRGVLSAIRVSGGILWGVCVQVSAQPTIDPFDVPTMVQSGIAPGGTPNTSQPKLETAFIPIQYAKTADLLPLLEGGEKPGLLSEYGLVRVEPRTNALIIRDTPDHLASIRSMIQALDIPVKQVRIEARIVIVSEGALDELGVRWGVGLQQGHFAVGSHIEQFHATGDGATESPSVTDFMNINLPSTSGNASSIAFQLAKLGSGTLLDLELSALQSESRAEIISSPSLLTTNHQSAFIEQGTEIPYQESSSDDETTIAFKKAVLSLEVTPTITPDHHMLLDLRVTQDRPGEVVKTGSGEAVAITTQRIGTQVLVNDGETVVLGGIYQKTQIYRVDKVPVLGELPLLGKLFQRNYQKTDKNELLIFVTPRVVIQ
ncbi:type IV pilus secretin (or competence protein) PilQ [Vibrio gazogenes DSM 21264]|uniref:Type IV pilus secretin (Or competence protein) PilQ n=1 Tax=Vibrio gazogenes DSM 21264 = NBRC 103151 TaxID=1123492 RepID=A0A1M5BF75_VIBGA|nr:type IV pilus secretin (or competence protein) PilQ [Vibrio gazogenes DSM 21264] [Vibrio gazogenes DSM 21264 = NBRC 103151]SJN57733.1 Type IV pilus biogenesis and competence protein PilQ precursor [Vibrio gazogenes]